MQNRDVSSRAPCTRRAFAGIRAVLEMCCDCLKFSMQQKFFKWGYDQDIKNLEKVWFTVSSLRQKCINRRIRKCGLDKNRTYEIRYTHFKRPSNEVPGDLLVQISVCHVGIFVGIGIAPQSTTDPVMKIRFAMLYSTFLSENVFIDNPGRVWYWIPTY